MVETNATDVQRVVLHNLQTIIIGLVRRILHDEGKPLDAVNEIDLDNTGTVLSVILKDALGPPKLPLTRPAIYRHQLSECVSAFTSCLLAGVCDLGSLVPLLYGVFLTLDNGDNPESIEAINLIFTSAIEYTEGKLDVLESLLQGAATVPPDKLN